MCRWIWQGLERSAIMEGNRLCRQQGQAYAQLTKNNAYVAPSNAGQAFDFVRMVKLAMPHLNKAVFLSERTFTHHQVDRLVTRFSRRVFNAKL